MYGGVVVKLRSWQDIGDRLAFAAAFLVVLMWISYAWERSTGLTWASRGHPGRISTPAHLATTRRTAIGVTAICGPLAVLYFVALRPKG